MVAPMSAWPDWLKQALETARAIGGDDGRAISSEAFKRWHDDLAAAGLCACGKEATHGKHCVDHAAKQRFAVERRRERMIEAGQCPGCNGKPLLAGQKHCGDCSAKSKKEHVAQYEAKKAAGVCVICKDDVVPGRIKCADCLESDKEAMRAQTAALVAAGKCVRCRLPSPTGSRRCASCVAKERVARAERRKPTRIVDAMRVVLEYEAEWFVTGVVVKDERYLVAKELVERRAI